MTENIFYSSLTVFQKGIIFMSKILQTDTTSTFIDNMSLPIHRWFRYTAGFSAQWIEETVMTYLSKSIHSDYFRVLDPFAGSGTTLLSCDKLGVPSYGYESHPLIYEIAAGKLLWKSDIDSFLKTANDILVQAENDHSPIEQYPDIVLKCYDEKNLKEIDHLKKALYSKSNASFSYKLSWLAFVSMLRASSHVGTAIWQYILPNKKKKKVLSAFEAFSNQVNLMCEDMKIFQESQAKQCATLIKQDARKASTIKKNSIDLIITSPPYANNYDYADATRLELSVLGEINCWGDLQSKIRPGLIRSCSQMVSKEKKDTFQYLKDPLLKPIYNEILDVCTKLDLEKENHGGRKNYHTMIALYFLDLAKVWQELRQVCKEGATVCFVIGDSAPYGIYVPVDKWLGQLAIAAGFKNYYFEKIRDRNVKWKNRKHKVPLKEGRLWIRG